jgi:phage terminase large subunit-like protein
LKELLKQPTTVRTGGSSYENTANLAPAFFEAIVNKYAGTRLGRQELEAQILDDVEGALWHRETMIEQFRVLKAPDLKRIVVGVDPATTSGPTSDENGIVVVGMAQNGHVYLLDDKSLRASPDGWAKEAVTAYHRAKADRIIAESNQGGEMVSLTIKTVDTSVPVKLVHASRGKKTRAEPVAALYEQGKVHHVGAFPTLEDEPT